MDRRFKYQKRNTKIRYSKPRYASKSTPRRGWVIRTYGNPMAITERKYFDTEYSAAIPALAASWAGGEADPATFLSLFQPARGTDYNQRIGRKVQLLSLKIRGHVTCTSQADQTAADPGSGCRVILVHDRQTNAAQLNAEDVISSGAGSQAINMFQNPAFFGRFRVMKDKRWILESPSMTYDGTNVEQSGLQYNFEWIWKFRKPMYIHFNGTDGGTIADTIDNTFHIIAGTNSASLVPVLAYKCRATFVDV